MQPNELVSRAVSAMQNAYAPYSGVFVGAALLASDGTVYTGCNIENAAFGPSVCAERTAFFKAISEGQKNFDAIAIVGGKGGVIRGAFPPCGVCRQVMAEFCDPDRFLIYLGTPDGYETYTLRQLLPVGFFPSALKEEN